MIQIYFHRDNETKLGKEFKDNEYYSAMMYYYYAKDYVKQYNNVTVSITSNLTAKAI